MNQHDMAILAVLGFAFQWLRQHRWFNDGLTILAALLGSALLVVVNHHAELGGGFAGIAKLVQLSFEHTPSVLGGTMAASMAAQKSALVPKFNSFKPEEGGKA